MASIFDDLLDILGLIEKLNLPEMNELATLIEEWLGMFTSEIQTTTMDVLQALEGLRTQLEQFIGQPDQEQELALVKKACENPIVGLGMALLLLPKAYARHFMRHWELFFVDEGEGPIANWKIEPLPEPGSPFEDPVTHNIHNRKYFIFSDVHRDDKDDDVNNNGNVLESGSIDHFKSNAKLYEQILDYALIKGYTVLEGGDCEELWFIRDIKDSPYNNDLTIPILNMRLGQIINTHQNIYEKLRELQQSNRYYRIQGNHDSFVKNESLLTSLKNEMGPNSHGDEFQVYDMCIIPGVKTMMEHSGFDMLRNVVNYLKEDDEEEKKKLGIRLIQGHVGLNSEVYNEKTQMVVAHGHQFDFWNNEYNQILGLIISNTAATFIDRHMDPFEDARGIALQGNTFVDFRKVFASLPVFNSFLSRPAAVEFAHRIQHMPNHKRILHDSVMYTETIPALWAAIGVALNSRDDAGQLITPAESRADIDFTSDDVIDKVEEYLDRHHFNHVCLGHTHNPQSQPYLTLANIGSLIPILGYLLKLVSSIIPDLIEPALKTTYFNSGTVGWMEGVIWAIEIDDKSQARLVYWTDKTDIDKGPEYMDWELKPLEQAIKDKIPEWEPFSAPLGELDRHIVSLQNRLIEWLKTFNVSFDALGRIKVQQLVFPIQTLAMALMEEAGSSVRTHVLQEKAKALLKRAYRSVGQDIQSALKIAKQVPENVLDALEEEFEEIRSFTFDIILSIKRRTLQGFTNTKSQFDEFEIRAKIPKDEIWQSLNRFRDIFKKLNMDDREAQHYAGIAHAIFDGFPHNLPFFSSMSAPIDPAVPFLSSDAPALHSLLSTLWMYPPDKDVNEASMPKVVIRGKYNVAMRSRFTILKDEVVFKVRLWEDGQSDPKPDPEPEPSGANV